MAFVADSKRYNRMLYRKCGKSGLKLPAVSLGLWHNFGKSDAFENGRRIVLKAFDLGITHFDLANNYGPPPGSAEESFGRILKRDLSVYRDELLISTKAGYPMWPGPYGDWGSRKSLLASLDQSLKRMGLVYVDIFYSHRFDPDTPIEETLGALGHAVRQGKALYAGISNYSAEKTAEAVRIMNSMGVPLLIHQVRYSMFVREPEQALFKTLRDHGVGCITFSPLAQGLLSDRYLHGIPRDSRAAKPDGFLKAADITEERLSKIRALNELAVKRGQTLAQTALAWILRNPAVTSVLVGASRVEQLEENVGAIERISFDDDVLKEIERILNP
jgi:L-glyceraldehyde 3-phosphate reductase